MIRFGWFDNVKPWINPFTPGSDQFQISLTASPEILHHTLWRTWLFPGYSERSLYTSNFSLPHSYISPKRLGERTFWNWERKVEWSHIVTVCIYFFRFQAFLQRRMTRKWSGQSSKEFLIMPTEPSPVPTTGDRSQVSWPHRSSPTFWRALACWRAGSITRAWAKRQVRTTLMACSQALLWGLLRGGMSKVEHHLGEMGGGGEGGRGGGEARND